MFEHNNVRNEAILRDALIFRNWRHQKGKNSARLPSEMESWVQSWQPRTNVSCDFSCPPVWSTAPATEKIDARSIQVIRSAAPVTQNHLTKPAHLILQNASPLRKSAPWPPNISHEHVLCTAPATENASLKILFKCPTPALFLEMPQNPHVLLTFDQVHNLLRLPRKTTSEPPKVARTCSALYMFTSKCASRHNGVHFFDIATSKNGPRMVCFVHFDFEMCFAPQQRALFWHLNFQKCSEAQVIPGVLYLFTSKSASRHNGVQLFISHLPRCLRTRRFSEPTFRPSGATIHRKNTVFRDFPTFSRICIFFLLTLSLLWSSLF